MVVRAVIIVGVDIDIEMVFPDLVEGGYVTCVRACGKMEHAGLSYA